MNTVVDEKSNASRLHYFSIVAVIVAAIFEASVATLVAVGGLKKIWVQ